MNKYIELMYRMTDMTEEDKENLSKFLDQLDEKYDINSIEDIDKINELSIDDITINSIEDLLEIKWENLDFEGIDWDDIEFETDGDVQPRTPIDDIITSPEDLRDDDVDISKYKYNKPNEKTDIYDEKDEIEIHINDDDNEESNNKPFIGKQWLEIDNKYMTYYTIDEDIEVSDINISLRNGKILLKNINDELSTESIPEEVDNINAELTDKNRILIEVW